MINSLISKNQESDPGMKVERSEKERSQPLERPFPSTKASDQSGQDAVSEG